MFVYRHTCDSMSLNTLTTNPALISVAHLRPVNHIAIVTMLRVWLQTASIQWKALETSIKHWFSFSSHFLRLNFTPARSFCCYHWIPNVLFYHLPTIKQEWRLNFNTDQSEYEHRPDRPHGSPLLPLVSGWDLRDTRECDTWQRVTTCDKTWQGPLIWKYHPESIILSSPPG